MGFRRESDFSTHVRPQSSTTWTFVRVVSMFTCIVPILGYLEENSVSIRKLH